MWGQVEAKDGFRVMAYDVPSTAAWDKGTIPYFVSVRSPLADAIAARWKKLSAGATVTQPLAPSGWAPLYGMLTDRYGITWVLDVSAEFNETVS